MPSSVINSIAKKSGKSAEEVEKLWQKAKKSVDKNYNDVKKDSDRYYELVTGVTKKMAGVNETTNTKTFDNLLTEEMGNLEAATKKFITEEEKTYWLYKDGKPVHEDAYDSASAAASAAKEQDYSGDDYYIVEYDTDKEEITDTMNLKDAE